MVEAMVSLLIVSAVGLAAMQLRSSHLNLTYKRDFQIGAAIANMNTAFDTWNTNNPTKLCNYKYNNVNGVITLGAAN